MISLKTRCAYYDAPYLSKEEIDGYASQLAEDFQPGILKNPEQLDIEGFLECYLGLDLDLAYLSGDGSALGVTIFRDGIMPVFDPGSMKMAPKWFPYKTIVIDSVLYDRDEMLPRCRFTIGHECGHFLFHRRYYGDYDPDQMTMLQMEAKNGCYRLCRLTDMRPVSKRAEEWSVGDRMEWQANRFSGALLMPAEAVQLIAGNKDFSNPENAMRLEYDVVDCFGVSKQAAVVRLHQLGYFDDVMYSHAIQGDNGWVDYFT